MAENTILTFRWERRAPGRLTPVLRQLGRAVLGRLGRAGVEVGVLITDDAAMRSLNRRWRDKDCPTDVLSFSSGEVLPEGRVYLGDVAISLETAARQAAERGVSLESELRTLLVHALLHLCGYDHETDGGEMQAVEAMIGRECG